MNPLNMMASSHDTLRTPRTADVQLPEIDPSTVKNYDKITAKAKEFESVFLAEMMKPMGVVMMTGMVISTIATLFITPVYYSLTDSVASRLSGLLKKIKLPKFNFHKKNPQQ